jgi:hypothetical protein
MDQGVSFKQFVGEKVFFEFSILTPTQALVA